MSISHRTDVNVPHYTGHTKSLLANPLLGGYLEVNLTPRVKKPLPFRGILWMERAARPCADSGPEGLHTEQNSHLPRSTIRCSSTGSSPIFGESEEHRT
jgi:hypothetical protein